MPRTLQLVSGFLHVVCRFLGIGPPVGGFTFASPFKPTKHGGTNSKKLLLSGRHAPVALRSELHPGGITSMRFFGNSAPNCSRGGFLFTKRRSSDSQQNGWNLNSAQQVDSLSILFNHRSFQIPITVFPGFPEVFQ